LDLPADAREALVEWRRALEHPDLRLVAPEALHVTLVFLGHLPEEEIPRIADAIEPPEADAPVLTAKGVKPVPPRRPRLFALDLDDEDGRAGRIQGAVSDALERLGRYEPEKRPFWPHVTLARVRKGARVGRIDVPDPPAEPWIAEAVTLYRSRLSPTGALYEALHRVSLSSSHR
jgi:2'-5' RNA ligase